MEGLIYLVGLVLAVAVVVEFFNIGRLLVKIHNELVALNAKLGYQTGVIERAARPASATPVSAESSLLHD
jgi:hypothetical protein